MNSTMVRVGAPLLLWLSDSDAGEALRHDLPLPHNDILSGVLMRAHYADVRTDGSIMLELLGLIEAYALREWVEHIRFVSLENAGTDAHERGRYNSARATLRVLDDYIRRAQ